MAVKRPKEIVLDKEENIIDTEIVDIMKQNYIDYSMSVILDRAIPDIRDGLKPSQRRTLYTMYKMGLTDNKKKKKEAMVVGECIGKYHPKGDASVKECLDRMGKPWIMREPLAKIHGNVGNASGATAAAARYVEANLTPIGLTMLDLLKKKAVEMKLNYTEEFEDPTILPSRFCNMLVNGAKGIAVGMATDIPPHNLKEVCEANIAYLQNENITTQELMKIIPSPDFPLGGTIINQNELQDIYETGKGRIILRVEPIIKDNVITFENIPYETNTTLIVDKITKLALDDTIQGIEDVNDFTGYDKKTKTQRLKIEIVLKDKKYVNDVLNKLYALTPLQYQLKVNMNCIVNGVPLVLSLKEVLAKYSLFLKAIHSNALHYDLDKEQYKLMILKGYEKALLNIEDVVDIIKNANDNDDALEKLKNKLTINDIQAKAILDLKLSKLTKMEVNKVKEDIATSESIIKDIENTLKPENFINYIINDLREIAKLSSPRLTKIINIDFKKVDSKKEIEEEIYIEGDETTGFIKKSKKGTKISSLANIYFFTQKGKFIIVPAHKLPTSFTAPVDLDTDDSIIYSTTNLAQDKTVVFVTKNGYVKSTSVKEYLAAKRTVSALKFKNPDDEIVGISIISNNEKIKIETSEEMYCIEGDTLNVTGRNTTGRQLIKLSENEYINSVT